MAQCTHNCDNCQLNCSDAEKSVKNMQLPANSGSKVKHIIGIVSGKGGVGKSMVTSLLASALSKQGFKVGILDADITGPSIPQAFGTHQKAAFDGDNILPVASKGGIKIISINLLLDNNTDAVIWRGPMIAGAVRQFWTDVAWGELDYLFVDMPPGTGDVPLTVFQSLPLDFIIIVSSPQQLVAMIVEKAANMAQMMFVPILGLVSNMSYYKCPNCGHQEYLFGPSNISQIADRFGINYTAELPIAPKIAMAADEGKIEELTIDGLENIITMIKQL